MSRPDPLEPIDYPGGYVGSAEPERRADELREAALGVERRIARLRREIQDTAAELNNCDDELVLGRLSRQRIALGIEYGGCLEALRRAGAILGEHADEAAGV
jgi:hypothetical protein